MATRPSALPVSTRACRRRASFLSGVTGGARSSSALRMDERPKMCGAWPPRRGWRRCGRRHPVRLLPAAAPGRDVLGGHPAGGAGFTGALSLLTVRTAVSLARHVIAPRLRALLDVLVLPFLLRLVAAGHGLIRPSSIFDSQCRYPGCGWVRENGPGAMRAQPPKEPSPLSPQGPVHSRAPVGRASFVSPPRGARTSAEQRARQASGDQEEVGPRDLVCGVGVTRRWVCCSRVRLAALRGRYRIHDDYRAGAAQTLVDHVVHAEEAGLDFSATSDTTLRRLRGSASRGHSRSRGDVPACRCRRSGRSRLATHLQECSRHARDHLAPTVGPAPAGTPTGNADEAHADPHLLGRNSRRPAPDGVPGALRQGPRRAAQAMFEELFAAETVSRRPGSRAASASTSTSPHRNPDRRFDEARPLLSGRKSSWKRVRGPSSFARTVA